MGSRIFAVILVLVLMINPGGIFTDERLESPGKVVLVLDASGSMWGRVKGRTKVEIARESVATLMATWDPAIEIGLIAYGHRHKNDCKDIELVLPVSRHEPGDMVKAVNKLNAVGKTPIGSALKLAAETLEHTKERATVILISDGNETCKMDPCTIAEALEQSGIAFTAHVIGFDLEKEETSGLKCIAEATGGMFVEAVDAASLTAALKAVEVSVVTAPPAIKVPPASRLVAVLTNGTAPLENQEINWIVSASEKESDVTRSFIKKYRHARPRVRLETGLYHVQVRTGLVVAEAMIQIDAENPVEHVVNLNAGQLSLEGFYTKGGEKLEKNVRWNVCTINEDSGAKDRVLDSTSFPSPDYTLSAGNYQIELFSGLVRAKVIVKVQPGDILKKKIFLNAGQVKLRAVLKEDGIPVRDSIHWYLTEKTANENGEYNQIDHNSNQSPVFTLGAGLRRFFVTVGSVKRVFEVDIVPDKMIEKTVILNAGQVKMHAINKDGDKITNSIRWTITRPEKHESGAYEQLAYSSYHSPTFSLDPGCYRVVIDYDDHQQIEMINVAAGERKDLRISLQRGGKQAGACQ